MRHQKSRFLILFSALLFLNSCAHLVHLDRAQNAFNRGASAENAQSLDFLAGASTALAPAGTVGSQGSAILTPELHYQLALAEVEKALGSESGLRKDGVLGTALTLKSLCEWKLGRYDGARKTALLAQQALAANEYRQPRDEAVIQAIEGLINSERAFQGLTELRQKLAQQTTAPSGTAELLSFFETIRTHYAQNISQPAGTGYLDSALKTLQQAEQNAGARSDLALYFLVAQLASLKTWYDELDLVYGLMKTYGYATGDNEIKRWHDAELARFYQRRDANMARLALLLPRKEQDSLYLTWKALLL